MVSLTVRAQDINGATDSPGSNTQGALASNAQDSTVDSYNTTNDSSKTTINNGAGAGGGMPVYSATAPSLMSSGSDSCLTSYSAGAQLFDFGFTGGRYKQDEQCNMRRDAKVLKDMGMTIAAISRMCQRVENWKAMFTSGSPCPIMVNGKLTFGRAATMAMRQNPAVYIPDYEDNENYYDTILGIGNENEKTDTSESDTRSVSERFRSSLRMDSSG